jgi:hypothetical protein
MMRWRGSIAKMNSNSEKGLSASTPEHV